MMRNFLLLCALVLLPAAAMAERPFAELLAAAERGDSAAMLATGIAYYDGNGVDQDCYEARSWLKKAAGAGKVEAYYLIGNLDDDGRCGIGRAERAVEYYRQAAEKGHAGAQYRLGELYRTGRGVDQDTLAAFKWLEASAAKGEPRAFCSLARIYAKGGEIQASRQKALRWLRRGLESHNSEAVELCRAVQAETGF
jgi:TPR repeat protein